MKKITKLRICDWTLLLLTIAILASGLQLEVNPTGEIMWVWVHIVLGTMFITMILWHIGLHHGSHPNKAPRHHDKKHRWLGILFALTLLSGIIATCHWIGSYVHSTIGGVHGKIGFLFIILVIVHLRKNYRFYTRRKKVK